MVFPRKILIVRLSALGDVVQTLPVLARLRETFPGAQIGWLVESQASVLLKGHPLLDRVHVSHRKRWTKALAKPGEWLNTVKEIRGFVREIEAEGYDVALDFQGLLKSAITTALTKIPRRVGFVAAREGAPNFYTHKVPLPVSFFDPKVPIRAHFDTMLQALGVTTASRPGYPLAPVSTEDHTAILQKLSAFYHFAPVVVLAPATQWESKHWPLSHWQGLLQALLDTTHANIALVGSPQDKPLCDEVVQGISPEKAQGRVLNLAGDTSVPQLISLFQVARVVVGSDSAPLHLAGAVNAPHVIGLYGPTSPWRTPPPDFGQVTLLTTPKALDCLYCDAAKCPLPQQVCMQGIDVAQVLAEIVPKLSE